MWTLPPIAFKKEPGESLADRVVRIAKSLVGQKEISGNAGFKDPGFQKRMQEVGWIKGHAWCTYTGELIWKESFTPQHPLYAEVDKCFSALATKTWSNFKASKLFKTGQLPKRGALAIYQYGKGYTGHLAVVVDKLPVPKFSTVEGNTNAAGGREGIEVAEKIRKTGEPFKAKGLNLLGFVYLPE
jgi:hypothetical protein